MIVFDPGMLRVCRKRLKKRLKDVARELCKSVSCIGKQENGDQSVSAEDLAVYANLYGVNISEFFKERISC